MSVWNWLAGHPSATPDDVLQTHVHSWLDKRRELKQAQNDTFEAMIAEALPGTIVAHENRETQIEREIMKIEIQIDKLLV